MNKLRTNYVLIFIIFFIFLFFISNLLSMQFTKGLDYLDISNKLSTNFQESIPSRGLILDRNLAILAKNTETFNVNIANIGNIAILDNQYLSNFNYKILNNIAILYSLDSVQANAVLKSLEEYKDNIKISKVDIREYKYPLEFSHIIGYTGKVGTGDLVAGNYNNNESIGKYRIEKQYEDNLKGTKGNYTYIDQVQYLKPSEPGQNIYLTIDKNWQLALYNVMKNSSEENNAAGGAGVIIDDSNGDVVAMTSYPGFDTNLLVKGISEESYSDLLVDRRKPLLDKAIGNGAAPGSIFKLITSHSLLENKVIDENSTFFSNRCLDLGGGYNFCEFGKFFYGDMNIVRALYKSSNIFYCHYMLEDYRSNKLTNLLNSANKFNIGQITGLDLQGEAKGNMDSEEYKLKTTSEQWYDGDTCNVSIGQGAILVTPIQMAMVASIINNDGVYYEPHVIEKISDVYGNIIQDKKVKILKKIDFEPDNLRLIKEGMNEVVHNPQGTVYTFLNDVPGNVRAKTGTAEVYERIGDESVYRTHGWIVGSFDYNNKSYSFALHLSYGGGGFYIAKAARDFINCVNNNFLGCI